MDWAKWPVYVARTFHDIPDLLTKCLEIFLGILQHNLTTHHNDEYSSSSNWSTMLKPCFQVVRCFTSNAKSLTSYDLNCHDQLCWNRDTDPGSAMPLRTLFHRFCGQERLHRQSTMSSAKNWTVSHRVNPRNSGRRFFMNSNTVSITRTKPKTFSRKAVWDGSISNYINTRLQPWYPNLEK
jgi:hypothetical protein